MDDVKLLRVLGTMSLFAIMFLAVPTLARAEWHGNAHLFLGVKNLSESDWEPVENQRQLGVEVDYGRAEWPIHIASDLYISRDDEGSVGLDVDGKTTEIALGVRKVFYRFKTVRPYFGGGVSWIKAEVEVEDTTTGITADDDDSAVGGWVGGGVFWRLGRVFNLGVGLRYSQAEPKLFDEDIKAGGVGIGALVGFEWPGGSK